MSMLLQRRCCCGCLYRIPLCPCEKDPEDCELYIECALAEAFFAAHPELDGALVFEFFDGSYFLCYKMSADPALKVTALPQGACLLEEIPPESTWFESCSHCCGSPCCDPCSHGSGAVCCYKLGDTGTLTISASAANSSVHCCQDGGSSGQTCPAVSYSAQYEVIFCDEAMVVFGRIAGAVCLPAVLQLNCGFGWQTSQHSCIIPDPCNGFGCSPVVGQCCGTCWTLDTCCYHDNIRCPAVDLPEPTCFGYTSQSRLAFVASAVATCHPQPGEGCPQPDPGCGGPTVCGCQTITRNFTANPSCVHDPDTNTCDVA